MATILSENALDKLPAGTRVWMIVDQGNSETYLRFSLDPNGEAEITGFIEKEDAEQMIRILKTGDLYKEAKIGIKDDLLAEVRNGAAIYEQPVYFLSHELAFAVFMKYPNTSEN